MDKRAQKGTWIFCILLCSLISTFSSSFAYGLESYAVFVTLEDQLS